MNLTIRECINDYCYYATRDINLFKEFLPLIIFIISIITILILIHLRYKQIKKETKK